MTSVFAPGRFGGMTLNENKVTNFTEKPKGDGKRINGGFFVLNKKVINLINDDLTIWENEPINRLAESGELYAYLHDEFWHPMDTIRDKVYLEELWNSKDCPWKIW